MGKETIKSMYLWSEAPGTGKTTSACALLNSYLITHYVGSIQRGSNPLQRPCFFLDVNEWQTDFNLAVMTDDKSMMESFKRKLNIAKDVPFLVMDDVGVRDISHKFRGYIHTLVNYRVTNKKATVYTSNIPIKYSGTKDRSMLRQGKVYDLEDVFGEKRLADRIGDQCVVIHFEGESKRGRR